LTVERNLAKGEGLMAKGNDGTKSWWATWKY